ncbi:MAG: helix-turn-helix domain-containing protein [Gaiellaceae bacterium]
MPDAETVTVARGGEATFPYQLARRLLEQKANWRFVSMSAGELELERLQGIRPEQLLARTIEARREQLGWTQGQLAEQLQALSYPRTQSQISAIERGACKIRVDHLVALAVALNTTPLVLLAGAFAAGDEPVAPTGRRALPRGRYRRWVTGREPLPRSPGWASASDEAWAVSFRRAVTDEGWLELQRTSLRLARRSLSEIVAILQRTIESVPSSERAALADAIDAFQEHVEALERAEGEYPSERPRRRERRGRAPRHR